MRLLFIFGIVLAFLNFTSIKAQEVISTSGNCFNKSNGSISYTIGEPVSETFSNNENVLTQGMNQPSLVASTYFDSQQLNSVLSVFPNPANEYVVLKFEKVVPDGMTFQLYDTKSNLIKECVLNQIETRISFLELPSSIYFIDVRNNNGGQIIYKIIKQ